MTLAIARAGRLPSRETYACNQRFTILHLAINIMNHLELEPSCPVKLCHMLCGPNNKCRTRGASRYARRGLQRDASQVKL